MIILTCLLICYNPRDNVEQELLKAGALDKEDIESLRSMRSLVDSNKSLTSSPSKSIVGLSSKNLSPTPNKSMRMSENMSPSPINKRQSSSNMMRRPSRRSSRISPTTSDSDNN